MAAADRGRVTLPSSRNTTYTPAVAVKSTDLNAMQDCIVAGKFGPQTFQIPALDFVGLVANVVPSLIAFPLTSTNIAAAASFPSFPVGTIVTAVRFSFRDNVAPSKVTGNVWKAPNTAGPGASTLVGSTPLSAGTGVNQVLAIASGLPLTIVAATFYAVHMILTSGSAVSSILGAEIDAYKP